MPKINFPQVQAIVDSFEALVTACEEWRDYLEQQRPATFRGREPAGMVVDGGFNTVTTGPTPPVGTPEHREFALNRKIDQCVGQVNALLELLEGDAFERLRPVVDRLGTLEPALRGEWI